MAQASGLDLDLNFGCDKDAAALAEGLVVSLSVGFAPFTFSFLVVTERRELQLRDSTDRVCDVVSLSALEVLSARRGTSNED